MGQVNNRLEILFQNPIAFNKEKKENPQYHGFGIKIIHNIVKKYNGIVQENIINDIYQTYISIQF